MKKLIWKYLFILLAISTFFLGIGAGLFHYYAQELPPLSELQRYDMKVGSEVFDKYDNLIHTFAFEHRKLTNINELPPYLIQTLLSVEDKNFYKHWGMDLSGNVRAIFVDVLKRRFSQGASTITQQLARNMFLSLDKQIPRKIKEAILAVRIETHFSKEEILEMYLNKVYFGAGMYGIEAASQKFFGKPAKELTIEESALLIGLIQLPNAYSPIYHPERAKRRRNIVLRRMLEEKVISKSEYERAKNDSILIHPPKVKKSSADYFIEYIRPRLQRKYGTNRLFTGGLRIYTTLDTELQNYADSVLNKHLTEFENKNNYEYKFADFPPDTTDIVTPYVQGGVFSIEPSTGYVRILIGGRNFNHSKFNRMMQAKRQPGSSFKPILYTTALVNGYTAATVIKDEPLVFIQSDTLFYRAHNYSKKNYGYIRMREALKHSRNIYAIKMIYDLGPEKVVDYAHRFGLTTKIRPYFTLAIGTSEVYPYELISAYTTFPNKGERVKPIFVRRVEDNEGNVLESSYPEKIRVIDEKVAFLMVSLMQSVVDEGTGAGIRWRGYKWNAAGKTGTTDDFRDAWFIGYNPELVTGIWVGFDDNSSLGKRQSGAVAALPAWPYIMKKALELESPVNSKGKPIIDGSRLEFEKPEGIIKVKISRETGLLPKNEYDDTIDEYFIAGTEPTPLSDSLNYNFYPTFYRENDKDSLVIDLGGKRYVFPDSIVYVPIHPDSTRPDYTEMVPQHLPTPIDLRGALIIKDKKIEIRPDSLLVNKPKFLENKEIN